MLKTYLAFNSDIMELLLAMASLKCFEFELRTKKTEFNLLQRLERQTALDL